MQTASTEAICAFKVFKNVQTGKILFMAKGLDFTESLFDVAVIGIATINVIH